MPTKLSSDLESLIGLFFTLMKASIFSSVIPT